MSLTLDQHVLTNAGLYGGVQFLAEQPAVNLVGDFFYHTSSILNILTTNSVQHLYEWMCSWLLHSCQPSTQSLYF